MTLEELNKMIDEAIKGAAFRPHAMKQTNILNAEYACGECMAYLIVIKKLFGIDAFVEANERIREARKELTERTQELYK